MKILFAVALLVLSGCDDKPTKTVKVNAGDFSYSQKPTDLPVFERVYTAPLSNGRTLKVTIKNEVHHYEYIPNIEKLGELDQPDGKYIFFDPDAIADKILDPQLVPVVQHLCDEIIATDEKWRESNPSEFTDESGRVWTAKP